jgi:hypothetical protein
MTIARHLARSDADNPAGMEALALPAHQRRIDRIGSHLGLHHNTGSRGTIEISCATGMSRIHEAFHQDPCTSAAKISRLCSIRIDIFQRSEERSRDFLEACAPADRADDIAAGRHRRRQFNSITFYLVGLWHRGCSAFLIC